MQQSRGVQGQRRSSSRTAPSLHHLATVVLILAASMCSIAESFQASRPLRVHSNSITRPTRVSFALGAAAPHGSGDEQPAAPELFTFPVTSRRTILSKVASLSVLATAAATLTSSPLSASASASADTDVAAMRALIVEAQAQLETVPAIIRDERWDKVRGVLTEAPLRDCWSKTTPILKKYADALGDTPDGDELAALEGREDLLQSLRFLDMAVYNNVFNPIATEGKTGASKALVDSYYNDPTREYETAKRAFAGLLELSK